MFSNVFFKTNIIFSRLGATKNRRKSFGPARIDIAFVKLMSGARESIRNRRRNSSVSTNGFHLGHPSENHLSDHRMPHTLEECAENENSGDFFNLKSSQNSTSNLDLLTPNGAPSKRKTAPIIKTSSSSNFFSKNSSSSNLANLNDSMDSENPQERKSLPEKVNFAATWVSARLLKKHRERRARRLDTEKSESSLREIETSKSELDLLSLRDLLSCRTGLHEVIKNPQCLRAFREFLDKEHSAENLSFWLASEEYRNLEDRSEKANQIHQRYIKVVIFYNFSNLGKK